MWSSITEVVNSILNKGLNHTFVSLFVIIIIALIVLVSINLRLRSFLKTERVTPLLRTILKNINYPITAIITVYILSLLVHILFQKSNYPDLYSLITDTRNVVMIIILAMFFIRVINAVSNHALRNKSYTKINLVLVAKLAQSVIFTITALLIADLLGFNISSILTIGGVGGIIAGLAARGLLENFFGAITIAMDKPFAVGDKIRSPDRNITGVVTKIGWRTTEILTYEKCPIYVPNSLFASIILQNDSRMLSYRINEKIRIRYSNDHLLGEITYKIESMLKDHNKIDQDKSILVTITCLGEGLCDILVYCFPDTKIWDDYMIIKQDVLLKISDIITREGYLLSFVESQIYINK